MTPVIAVFLGVLQGLTEFLPISSSGHLALAQMLIPGFSQPGVVFDAILHVGTAGAVLFYERREIARWLSSPGGHRLLVLLVFGTLVTSIIAFPLRSVAESAFVRPVLVGICLVATGLVVASTRWLAGGTNDEKTTTWWQVAVIGLAQGAAVFPGLSRSGFTIATGLRVGLSREWAARFSFLLGVPAICGVAGFQLIGERDSLASMSAVFWVSCLVGAVAAGLAGYIALNIVVKTLSSRVFHRFSWYCLPLGVLVVALTWGSS
jgi:undecaprenyl-diphosphatase